MSMWSSRHFCHVLLTLPEGNLKDRGCIVEDHLSYSRNSSFRVIQGSILGVITGDTMSRQVLGSPYRCRV